MKTVVTDGQGALFELSPDGVAVLDQVQFDAADPFMPTAEEMDRETAQHLLQSVGFLAVANQARGFVRASEMPTPRQRLLRRYGPGLSGKANGQLQVARHAACAARDEFYLAMGEEAPTTLEPGDPDVQLLWLGFRRLYGQTGQEGIEARRALTSSLRNFLAANTSLEV